MRNRKNTSSKAAPVRAVKLRNPVVLAVVQRLGTMLGSRHDDRRVWKRLQRMDLDQRVREIGEW